MFRHAILLCFVSASALCAQVPAVPSAPAVPATHLPAQAPSALSVPNAPPSPGMPSIPGEPTGVHLPTTPQTQSSPSSPASTSAPAAAPPDATPPRPALKPGELPPASDGPRMFLLQPGTCAPLAPGDYFSFSIKPIFATPMANAVIGDVTVGFQTREPQKKRPVTHFYANDNLLDHPRDATPHGYAKVSFRPDLTTIPPGEYHLANVSVRGALDDQTAIAEINITHGGPQAVEALSQYCVIVPGTPGQADTTTNPTGSTVLIEPLSLPN